MIDIEETIDGLDRIFHHEMDFQHELAGRFASDVPTHDSSPNAASPVRISPATTTLTSTRGSKPMTPPFPSN